MTGCTRNDSEIEEDGMSFQHATAFLACIRTAQFAPHTPAQSRAIVILAETPLTEPHLSLLHRGQQDYAICPCQECNSRNQKSYSNLRLKSHVSSGKAAKIMIDNHLIQVSCDDPADSQAMALMRRKQ
jgi:hypothetical protein